jgi:replicative DNA helicase
MSEARFQAGADVLSGWHDDLLSGTPPVLYPIGAGEFARIEVGPGLVTLVGGAPGAGKTALAMQWAFDALRLTPALRVVVCNVEMAPAVLLDRQLARLSGIDLSLIRHRKLGAEHAERLDPALATLEPLAERLAFVRPPFDLGNVAATADAFEAGLLLLDYVQRIPPPGQHPDRRGAVDASMSYLRQFADAGVAVVALAAVSRSKDSKGRSSYREGLSLASFRESSELEFGADDAFLLLPEADNPETVTLKHLKSRHGEPLDLPLAFNRRLQRFTPSTSGEASRAGQGKLREAIAALWERTAPAPDNEQEDEEDAR